MEDTPTELLKSNEHSAYSYITENEFMDTSVTDDEFADTATQETMGTAAELVDSDV